MGRRLDQLIQDVKLATRSLLRAPAFTSVAVLTLSVGVGASTAIFSVVKGVLLQPLPFPEADRLVFVRGALENRNVFNWPISPRILLDMREQSSLLDGVGGIYSGSGTLVPDDSDAIRIEFGGVTPNLFSLLGVRPVVGRDFTEDDAAPVEDDDPTAGEAPAVVMLSYGLWERLFGSDPAIVGRSVMFLGQPHEVVGVMPESFDLLMPSDSRMSTNLEAWVVPRIDLVNADRRSAAFEVVARLAPGATVPRAQAQIDALSVFLHEASEPLRGAEYSLRVAPIQDEINAEVRPVILTLFGAVGFVLLIACANVSNLLLVRSANRQGELAIRSALGASRRRVLRQLITESTVLALLGVVPGVALALFGLRGLLALGPPDFPRMDAIGVDPSVLAFSVVVSLAAALVFGTAPALQASRSDVGRILNSRGRSPGLAGRGVLRNFVLVAESALSVVLLIGAGLMIRSFVALQTSDPGFEVEGLLTFRLQLQGDAYGREERRVFVDALERRLSGLPGVESVSAGIELPFTGGGGASGRYGTREALDDDALYGQAEYRYVYPDYLRTMETALLEGRTFEPGDYAGEGTPVVLVDDIIARRLWAEGQAVGQTLIIRSGPEPEPMEVIGVVRHQRSSSPAFDSQETVYFTARLGGDPRNMQWVVRTSMDPTSLATAVRREIRALDPQLPVSGIQTMEDAVKQVTGPTRFALVLIGVFAATALSLASLGLYSVLAYTVRRRTAEIGLRMALGAEASRVRGLIMWQGIIPTLIGIGVGVVVAVLTTRSMSAMLVGVEPVDFSTFALSALMFLAIASLATLLPARRATSIDPLDALRGE